MTTYYVNQSGTNGNALTLAAGKTTIAAGVALLSAGDTLLINNGTYTESITNFPSGISSSAPTIIQAINRRMVTVNGVSANSYVIEINSKNYQTIDGLVVDAVSCNFAGIVIGDHASGSGGVGSTYITIQNCTVKNANRYTGIAYHNSGPTVKNHHWTILDNIVQDCGGTNPTIDGFDPHGIYIVAYDSLIQGNYVANIGNSVDGGAGIHQYFGGNGGLHNNVYTRNRVTNCWGSAFLIADGNNALVFNNVGDRNARKDEGSGGVTVLDGSTAGVYNNTFYLNNGAAVFVSGGASNTQIKNNIFWQNGTTVTNSGSGTIQSNNLTSDPLMVDPANGDFRLQSGSPAIDTAVTLTYFSDDFFGNARV